MLINFDAPILGLDGSPVPITDAAGNPVPEHQGGGPTTLKRLAVTALLSQISQGGRAEELPLTEKVRLGLLAQKIYAASEPIELPVSDVDTLQKRIGSLFTQLAVMRAFALLEGKDEAE